MFYWGMFVGIVMLRVYLFINLIGLVFINDIVVLSYWIC